MHILFVMLAFPDIRFDSNIYTDLVEEFISRGFDVKVVAPCVKENTKAGFTLEKQIPVLRVQTGRLFNIGFFQKGWSTICLKRQFLSAIRQNWPDISLDLIICPTPPITFAGVMRSLKKSKKATCYLILRDIFPQNALDLGIIKNPLLGLAFRHIEKNLYKCVDSIGCMSEGNIKYIKQHNTISSEKLHILPNFKNTEIEEKCSSSRDFRKEWLLGNKIVALFGGVIGIAQELEFLLEIAESYRDDDRIVFLVVGEGNRKNALIESIAKRNLANIIVKDSILRSEFAQLVKTCDIGLVMLNRNFTIPNIPSKTLEYFQAEKPILAAIDRSTDYGEILKESGGGFFSYTGDVQGFRENCHKLIEEKTLCINMGRSGLQYLKDHWSVKNAADIILAHTRKIESAERFKHAKYKV